MGVSQAMRRFEGGFARLLARMAGWSARRPARGIGAWSVRVPRASAGAELGPPYRVFRLLMGQGPRRGLQPYSSAGMPDDAPNARVAASGQAAVPCSRVLARSAPGAARDPRHTEAAPNQPHNGIPLCLLQECHCSSAWHVLPAFPGYAVRLVCRLCQ